MIVKANVKYLPRDMGPVNTGQVRKDVHLLVNNQYLRRKQARTWGHWDWNHITDPSILSVTSIIVAQEQVLEQNKQTIRNLKPNKNKMQLILFLKIEETGLSVQTRAILDIISSNHNIIMTFNIDIWPLILCSFCRQVLTRVVWMDSTKDRILIWRKRIVLSKKSFWLSAKMRNHVNSVLCVM